MARPSYTIEANVPGDSMADSDEKWRYQGARGSERTAREYAFGTVANRHPGKLIRIRNPDGTLLLEAMLSVWPGGQIASLSQPQESSSPA